MILGSDGKIRPTFPTATGDLLDFPGWHQPGVTAIGPGPLLQENGKQRFEFVYRPSFARQRSLGQTGGVVVSLVTPTSNVLSVTRHERPPHGALAFGLAVSAVILAGGAYLAFPRSDDSSGLRNFRLGVGLPLAAVGLAGGTFSVVMLLRSDRDVAIPLEHARGLP